MPEIFIPHNWRPKIYQRPAWQALEAGKKRALLLWHRRAGKDDVALHWTARQCMENPGTYWTMLPRYEQARKAIWEATVRHPTEPGQTIRRIDWAFPKEIREHTREDMMRIRFKNGSVWQVVGSDAYDSLVGTNPRGVTLSEFALSDPEAWAFISPILRENGGFALFVTTPRGRNHAATMFDSFKDDPDWFVERLTAHETDVFSVSELEAEKKSLVSQYGPELGKSLFRQEYLCSFEAPVLGAYYASELDEAEQEDRICKVPYDPNGSRVFVSFDLGWRDHTAIWFVQRVGRRVHVLDFYSGMMNDLDVYVREIEERFPRHQIDRLILPHDGAYTNRQTNLSDADFFRSKGFTVGTVERPASMAHVVMQEIQAVRRFLPKCVFDREKCANGLAALRNYRAMYDEKMKVLGGRPVHDWSSHGADSFRTLVMWWERSQGNVRQEGRKRIKKMGVPV